MDHELRKRDTREAIMTRNRSWSGTRSARAAFVILLTLGLSALLFLPAAVPAAAQAPAQAPQGATSNVRAVLAQYGNFVQHQKYGEVWVPSVTPPGWHPYPPCHWVYTKQLRLVFRRQDTVGSDRPPLWPLDATTPRPAGSGYRILNSAQAGWCGERARNGSVGRRRRLILIFSSFRAISSTTAASGSSSRSPRCDRAAPRARSSAPVSSRW